MNWIDLAWTVISVSKWISLVIMLSAVGIFAQYMFQRYVNRDRTLENKPTFSREGRVKLALIVFGCGFGLQLCGILLANLLPSRI